MFPLNAWYVACTPDEFAERPLGRTVCGEAMVIYRDGSGKVAVLEDYCPHRGAPLSLGQVCEGKLVCGYHGLEMGCDGKTIAMPDQRVQKFPAIRVFTAVERYGFIWVWPGDPALADEAGIQSLPWADSPDWAYGGGLYHMACNYKLLIDNLMDLTHETYVHATSIGQKEITHTPCETRVEGDEVITSRFMHDIMPPPFWKMALRMNDLPDNQKVDRWQICHFTPPTHVLIEVGVALAGKGGYDAPKEFKASTIVVDFITPENENSVHYFWGMARNFKPRDASLTTQIREGQGKIFAEDKELLERQQLNLLRHPGRRLMTLNIDAGGAHSRRVLDRLMAKERPAASA